MEGYTQINWNVNTSQSIGFEGELYYSVWNYFLRLVIVVGLIFVCFITLGDNSSPLSGFISSSIAFLLITIATALILLPDRKWIRFFSLAYFIKLLIGLVHFLYFLAPAYFETNGTKLPMPHDFTSAFDCIKEIVASKQIHGLFHYEEVYWSHPEILNLMSYPFVYFGTYILNIAPLNSFMSIFSSINILLISQYVLHCEPRQLKFIAILTAFFPLTLISSIFYRDVTGMALMSIGLTLIMLSAKGILQFIMLAIACYLFYLQRTIYPLVLIVSFSITYLMSKESAAPFKRLFSFIVFIAVFIVLLKWSLSLGLSEEQNSSYVEAAKNVNYLFFPVKLVMGIIGPFPWNQYFTTGRTEFSYQFADYLQGALNVGIVALIFLSFRSFFGKGQFNLLNITGLSLMLIGLATTQMHSSYVSIGILFLIPWVINSVSWSRLKRSVILSFICLLLLSLIITEFLGNLGLRNLWM